MNEKPHPTLIPLLEKHQLSWQVFSKKGRPPVGVREKRSAIVTELHNSGVTWVAMMEITGLSNGAIQRLTNATWNPKSRENRAQTAARIGRAWKGKKRPGQLNRQWEKGDFDSLKGRCRTLREKQRLREGWTTEAREKQSRRLIKRWKTASYRQRLLDFHRSPSERARRSEEQSLRMVRDPSKWTRGRGSYVFVSRCTNGPCIWVRSSYEKAAVSLLESDQSVISYTYEPEFTVSKEKRIRLDFLVKRVTGEDLIEVKASWVLQLPDSHKVSRRLQISRELAACKNWGFEIWTEKGVLQDVV